LIGSADAAVPGDDLDVTVSRVPSPETVAETGGKEAKVAQMPTEGLSMFHKLFFFGAVVGVVGIFVRTRKTQSHGVKEKSMA